MTDQEILHHISALIDEEHALLEEQQTSSELPEERHARLKALQVQLDQLWDLLRQRRARREYHEDPDAVQPRDPKIVEHFQQ
jgi:hypothetical protein